MQIADGHEVHVISDGENRYSTALSALGAQYHPTSISRFIAPGCDIRLFVTLLRLLHRIKPDIVHTATIKPNIFGILAAFMLRVPRRVMMLVGLGYVFAPAIGLKRLLLRVTIEGLYRTAMAAAHRICVVNRDDLEFLKRRKFAAPSKLVLIKSGIPVDGDRFNPARMDAEARLKSLATIGINEPALIVLMVVARLITSKGVGEYIAAARLIGERRSDVKFVLIGPNEPGNPDAVGPDLLGGLPENFIHLDFMDEIADITIASDIVVLPSYYPEGLPIVLVEGMAAGKPLVATNNVGCREAVIDGENGYLVEPRNAAALAERIECLLSSSELRTAMGARARAIYEANFTPAIIYLQIMDKLYGCKAVTCA